MKFIALKDPQSGSPLDVYTRPNGEPRPLPYRCPEKIRVLGKVFRIYCHTFIYSERKLSSRLRGVVLHDCACIVIDPQQSRYDFLQTLIHELGHVYVRDMERKDKRFATMTNELEEGFCDLLGNAVLDLQGTTIPRS